MRYLRPAFVALGALLFGASAARALPQTAGDSLWVVSEDSVSVVLGASWEGTPMAAAILRGAPGPVVQMLRNPRTPAASPQQLTIPKEPRAFDAWLGIRESEGNNRFVGPVTIPPRPGMQTPRLPPPPPAPPGAVAELPILPQAIPDTVRPAVQRQVRASSAAELRAAIADARAGDEILLTPGTTYTASGDWTFPARNDGGWVIVRTDVEAPLERVDSTLNFAVLTCAGDNCKSIYAEQAGDHGWRFELLEVTSPGGRITSAVRLGEGRQPRPPRRFVFDRVYIHPQDRVNGQLRRCVQGNASSLAVLRSVIVDCHQSNTDSQGIAVWNSEGPILYYDNLISASTMPWVFGGADAADANTVPTDITIVRNHFWRPNSWKGGPWTHKNLGEFKVGIRVLVEGNVFENHWRQGQQYGLNFKTANQGGGFGAHSETGHVTFRLNILRNVDMGMNLSGIAGPASPGVGMHHVLIEHVLLDDVGPSGDHGRRDSRTFLIHGTRHLTIRNVTAHNPNGHSAINWCCNVGGPTEISSFVFHGPTRYGVNGDASRWSPVHRYSDVFAVGDNCSRYPRGWRCPASAPPGQGADLTAVRAATAGVVR